MIRVIYLYPDLQKWSDERIIRLVAHETAHLVLGHLEQSDAILEHGDVHVEEATDRKVESWGFNGAYSKAARRRLAAKHDLEKRRRAEGRKA